MDENIKIHLSFGGFYLFINLYIMRVDIQVVVKYGSKGAQQFRIFPSKSIEYFTIYTYIENILLYTPEKN